jgi:hypothetical protein
MKQFILGAAATSMLLASVLTGATSAAAYGRCSGGFYLHHNNLADPSDDYFWEVFGSKDANNNNAVCVRGSGPNPENDPNAITVIDDR